MPCESIYRTKKEGLPIVATPLNVRDKISYFAIFRIDSKFFSLSYFLPSGVYT